MSYSHGSNSSFSGSDSHAPVLWGYFTRGYKLPQPTSLDKLVLQNPSAVFRNLRIRAKRAKDAGDHAEADRLLHEIDRLSKLVADAHKSHAA